jgi:hypothetical protein
MSRFVSKLPKTEALKKGLAAAFRADGLGGKPVTLLNRELSPYSTTFPCEIVTCQRGRTPPLRLFCKYTAGVSYTGHGHRGRVGYEIAVYREILAPMKRFRPRFYGGYLDPETGDDWLFLEYLDGSLRVGKLGFSGTPRAARWIARFHAATERPLENGRFAFLTRYDWNYYLSWVHRTSEFAGSLHRRYPWLRPLCDRSKDLLAPLLEMPPTVIHGEYYQHNVLYHRRKVCPVDWESAAVGSGLIDLAMLTEGWWADEVVRACTRQYQRTRWPEGAPHNFEQAVRAAHLYLNFRWLGDEKRVTHSRKLRHRFERLKQLGHEMGAI